MSPSRFSGQYLRRGLSGGGARALPVQLCMRRRTLACARHWRLGPRGADRGGGAGGRGLYPGRARHPLSHFCGHAGLEPGDGDDRHGRARTCSIVGRVIGVRPPRWDDPMPGARAFRRFPPRRWPPPMRRPRWRFPPCPSLCRRRRARWRGPLRLCHLHPQRRRAARSSAIGWLDRARYWTSGRTAAARSPRPKGRARSSRAQPRAKRDQRRKLRSFFSKRTCRLSMS
ncbi:Uncharacterised protein [Sphingomonas paucimobilis]|nr:Uncharacterised protein [Sphingomonas paucimobilis]